ncbi:hypothetical protein BGX29_007034, partial [Mortierella sp. GBA35]
MFVDRRGLGAITYNTTGRTQASALDTVTLDHARYTRKSHRKCKTTGALSAAEKENLLIFFGKAKKERLAMRVTPSRQYASIKEELTFMKQLR